MTLASLSDHSSRCKSQSVLRINVILLLLLVILLLVSNFHFHPALRMKLTSSCMAHLSSAVVCATSMRRSSSRNWRGRRGSCAHSRSSSTMSSSRQVRMNLKERWTGSWRGLCTCWKPPKVSHRWTDWFYFTKITFIDIVLPQMAMAWDSSDSLALSTFTFSRVGSLSSNGLSVHVLVYSSGIVWNELICGYASVVHTLSSLRAHTHIRMHACTFIWGPQTDGAKACS